MSLIIENGTQIANANSYVSLADARVIAGSYGITLDADDATAENNLKIAYKWLNTQESKLQGSRLSDQDTSTSQTGVFPRSAVKIRGNEQDKSSIPDELIDSQIWASFANQTDSILTPSQPSTTGSVIEESLDGVGSVKYSDGYTATGAAANTALTFASELLKPLFKTALGVSGAGYTLRKGYS